MDRKRLFELFLDVLAVIGLAAMLLLAGLFLLFKLPDETGAETFTRPEHNKFPSPEPVQASQ
jgi:hypothetical protein